MLNDANSSIRIGRRAFLRGGVLTLGSLGLDARSLFGDNVHKSQPLKVGLVTDLHYADKPPAGSRYYRETLDKLAEAATRFEKDEPSFIVELGDFIDAADSVETEQTYLKTIN